MIERPQRGRETEPEQAQRGIPKRGFTAAITGSQPALVEPGALRLRYSLYIDLGDAVTPLEYKIWCSDEEAEQLQALLRKSLSDEHYVSVMNEEDDYDFMVGEVVTVEGIAAEILDQCTAHGW